MIEDLNSHHLEYFLNHLLTCQKELSTTFSATLISPKGHVVARKGEPLTADVASKFEHFHDLERLLKCISVQNMLNASSLAEDFKRFVDESDALREFASAYTDWGEIERHCQRLNDEPLLLAQLSILKQRLPAVYAQGLFCAWLGCALMHSLKRLSGDNYHIFVLGLAHDIGQLYCHCCSQEKSAVTDYQHVRHLRSHTVIGFSVLKITSHLPEEVAVAALEHHEHLDGTGYPQGKVGQTISRLGLLLNFLDAINAIYTKRIKPGDRSLYDLIPMVQMNGHSRFGLPGKLLIEWLKKLPESTTRAVPNALMPAFIQVVRDRNIYISSCIDIIACVSKDIGFRHGDAKVFALQNAIIHINISITQSGIINPAYIRWLDQVEGASLNHAYREVEDVFLMMQEVIYHISQLRFQMEFYLNQPCTSEEIYKIKKALERLERVILPSIPSSLTTVWITGVQ